MAYETGVALDARDLLAKFIAFCASNGCSTMRDTDGTADGFVEEKIVTIQTPKGDHYTFNTRMRITFNQMKVPTSVADFHGSTTWYTSTSTTPSNTYYKQDTINVFPHTGVDAAGESFDQPAKWQHVGGDSVYYTLALEDSVENYWFFLNTDADHEYFHIVAEYKPGHFSHMHFGQYVPYVALESHRFAAGTKHPYTYNNSCRALFQYSLIGVDKLDQAGANALYIGKTDDGNGNWVGIKNGYYGAQVQWLEDATLLPLVGFIYKGTYSDPGPNGTIYDSYNHLTGRVNLRSQLVFGPAPDGAYHPLGYLPDISHINTKVFLPGDIVTMGSDEFMVFPVNFRGTPWSTEESTQGSYTYENSWNGSGYAIRKT